MCLTLPPARRHAVASAFDACHELPELLVNGALLFVRDPKYSAPQTDRQGGAPRKVLVLQVLRLAGKDFKARVDEAIVAWMQEAVDHLRKCRESALLDARTARPPGPNLWSNWRQWWDQTRPKLEEMFDEATIDVLRYDVQFNGKSVQLGADVCTFFSLALNRCQMKAIGMCKCKGPNKRYMCEYELEGERQTLFCRVGCLEDCTVPTRSISMKSDKPTSQLTCAMMQLRNCELPICSRYDFCRAIGADLHTGKTWHYAPQMLVCKHSSLPGKSIEERLRLNAADMAHCRREVQRRKAAKERRLVQVRKMLQQDAIDDVNAQLAYRANIPVDSIDALESLCEGMAARLRFVCTNTSTGGLPALTVPSVRATFNRVAFFLGDVLSMDRASSRGDICSSQAYDFASGCDLALYGAHVTLLADNLGFCISKCLFAMHVFDAIRSDSLSVHAERRSDSFPHVFKLDAAGMSAVVVEPRWPLYDELKRMHAAAVERFPDKDIPEFFKKISYTRGYLYNGSKGASALLRDWMMRIFGALADDPSSRGIALCLVGLGPRAIGEEAK